MAVNGGRSGFDVELFHRVEAERKRLGNRAVAPTTQTAIAPSDVEADVAAPGSTDGPAFVESSELQPDAMDSERTEP